MGDLWEIWVVMLYRNHDNSWAPLLKISGELLRLAVGTWAVCGTRAAVPCITIWRWHFLQLVQVARLKFPWIYRTTIIWQRKVHRLRSFVLEIPLWKDWHFLHRVHGVTMQHGTKGGIVIYCGGEPRRLRNLVTGLIIINLMGKKSIVAYCEFPAELLQAILRKCKRIVKTPDFLPSSRTGLA